MNPETIVKEAKESLTNFCLEECKALCCRKGFLVLKPDQVELVTQNRKEELIEKKLLKELPDGNFSLNMSNHDIYCPSLCNLRCKVYKDRPQACADFPMLIRDKKVLVSSRCPAVAAGKLFPFIKQLTMLGYKYELRSALEHFDIYRCDFLD